MNFEPSKEMMRIREHLEAAPDGAFISYAALEAATRVKMDIRGKALMRSAFRSLKRSYRVARGVGVEIESPHNVMGIVTGHIKRVDNGLKRTGKVSKTLMERHLQYMDEEDRPRLTAVVSLMGAIQAVAGGLRRLYSDKPEALNTVPSQKLSFRWKP